jgi:hypothetical protein
VEAPGADPHATIAHAAKVGKPINDTRRQQMSPNLVTLVLGSTRHPIAIA